MSYRAVMDRVRASMERSRRDPEDVTVVAVSKTKTIEDIAEVYALGHRDFGENRAAELAAKASALPSDIRWHFVGALQSNKARLVRPVTHLLHSMDRRSLAGAWLKGPGLPPPVLIEVNLGAEEQKAGVNPADLHAEVPAMMGLGIEVRGLMAIPPVTETPEGSRPHFRRLRELRDQLAAEHPAVLELSMGMTDDFEVAIEEGASIIRVGRAIFGPRD